MANREALREAGLLPTPADAASLDDLLALDARARHHAQAIAQELTP